MKRLMLLLAALAAIWPIGAWAGGIKDNPDALSFWLAGGAVAGGLARAIFTHGLMTFYRERKTWNDIVISFLAGWLCPLFFPFPAEWSRATKVVVMAGIAYVTGDVLVNGVTKGFGFFAQKAVGPLAGGDPPPKP